MKVCEIHHRELDSDGNCKDCNGKPAKQAKIRYYQDSLQFCVEDAWEQFEKFQKLLLKEKPKNWERDIKLMDQLKKQIGKIHEQLKRFEP